VKVEQHDICGKPADYIGDAHFFGFSEGVAKDDDVKRFALTRCQHLTHIMGLGDTMAGSFEIDSPVRQQRAIEADI